MTILLAIFEKKALMKKILCSMLILCFCTCNDSLENELQDLKNELNLQKKLLETIQSNVSIESVINTSQGYTINLSDNTSISILNGITPTIKIGSDGNWIINDLDTGINAIGKDGKNGIIPEIKIGSNGNWIIDGSDTGINAEGIDGSDGDDGVDAPVIQTIVQTETDFVFNFSDGKEIIVPVFSSLKRIACWGDSLTANNIYPKKLKELLGVDYQVVNCGVGGESSTLIGGRQGGLPIYLSKSFVIPENNKDEVVLGSISDLPFFSTYNEKAVYPLLQGGYSTINNCVIDSNICNLKWTGKSPNDPLGEWTIRRVDEGISYEVPPYSLVLTSSMRKYRNLYANVFFIGQNGGFVDGNDLVNQYKKMIEFSGSSNYILVGFHKYKSVSIMKDIESIMTQEFGARYINLREYLNVKGLIDADLTPTPEDLIAIEKGECPPQLLYDGLHFTSKGYDLLANQIYKRMQNLGIAE